ncbi:methylmalonyl Co-A mutase-associated GTPase MeaB [Rhodoplanes serenus]|uniref:Methylmalonyl Co-A mutase-associated GTPase MeaB n=1 Tax=Rhodoplanes serenus TaxID=200615 RepID=A0A327K4N0_9BRAD|nr:methylmalonyl Co-A mutase-associated GTPase MeaB [Rhodoplanes serenus]MTW15115.1 methylmalonyl Co-A mutase-associated GTPase MeaB [Rhodoplanes serenus]RAI32834.1 methylmalonyl Co-A mutase-associated GTPase MeaB [Rhodoplanes serenus]
MSPRTHTAPSAPDIDRLVAGVRAGQRAVLARAITLAESKRADHQLAARALVQALLPDTGQALRVGITGAPGVGKSTTIDALGAYLTGQGHRVAVLAVDPSSARTGGSILGDKTRMAQLSADPHAFIRPSPSAGTLGGVAAKTRETMLICEAAGYDVILVETVGTGQSETTVADMTDFFLALMLPGAGDELQGIKKGLVELADMIAVNKADGDNLPRARTAAAEYRAALHILSPRSPNWQVPVVTYSAYTGDGLAALWAKVVEHRDTMTKTGELAARRRDQQVKWMWSMVEDRMRTRITSDPSLAAKLPRLEADVADGRLSPAVAVDRIFAALGW